MIQALRNAMTLPDLRRKLLYTLLILVIYRLAAQRIDILAVVHGARLLPPDL